MLLLVGRLLLLAVYTYGNYIELLIVSRVGYCQTSFPQTCFPACMHDLRGMRFASSEGKFKCETCEGKGRGSNLII